MPEQITVEEWLAELESLGVNGDNATDALTALELAETLGKPVTRVRQALAQIARSGRLEVVRRSSTTIDGRAITVPAYRVKPAPKPARKRK